MSNTKKVTISLTPEQQAKARSLSKDLFGKENISGLIGFLIERWEKNKKLPQNFNRSGQVAMEHNVLQLHVCCVKVQNYLSVKHEAERYKTINKLITM